MGGVQDTVKAVFIDKVLVAVLHGDVEPVTWLTRNDFVLMGNPEFGAQSVKVPIRHVDGGATVEAVVHTMPIER